jgi:hypothetical protein
VLGITMSDLMGLKLLPIDTQHVLDNLHELTDEEDLPDRPVRAASIQFRGEQPRIKER